MKLKTSFFNKTIFAKNLTLFWPIWTVYLLFLLAMLPLNLLIRFQRQVGTQRIGYSLEQRNLAELNEVLGQLNLTMVAVFIVAGILAMALFNYLFNSRSANMIHALPVTRGELFGTNVISGLAFLIVPEAISFITSVFVCLAYGVTCVQHLASWLIAMIGISFFSYGMAVFCAMLTGQMFAVAAYYVIANFLYVGVRSIIGLIISTLTFGVEYYDVINAIHLERLSPFYYLYRLVSFNGKTKWQNDQSTIITGITFEGAEIIAGYAVFALLLYVLAYLLYRKRKLEKAGDLLTVSFVKPIFRWGVGFTGSLVLAYVVSEVVKGMCIGSTVKSLIVGMLIFGLIFFFVAEMLIQKSFKVFHKKKWLEWAAFSVFLLCAFGGMCGVSNGLENKMPESEDVAVAFIEQSYPIEYDGENAKEVIELHHNILNHKEELKKDVYIGNNYNTMTIKYVLKNGERFQRTYAIPQDKVVEGVSETIYNMEENTDAMLKNQFCYDYKQTVLVSGSLDLYDSHINSKGSRTISEKDIEMIYNAFLKDLEEHNIQKYYMANYSYMYDQQTTQYTSDLYFDIRLPEGATFQNMYKRFMNYPMEEAINGQMQVLSEEEEMEQGGYGRIPYEYKRDGNWRVGILFGEDCTNLVQALVDCGIIESEDELETYDTSMMDTDTEYVKGVTYYN